MGVRVSPAALIHDSICRFKSCSEADDDELVCSLMVLNPVPAFVRELLLSKVGC